MALLGVLLLHCTTLFQPVFADLLSRPFVQLRTEDDVLYIPTLPDFDGSLGQHDSELLLSYLTVPYIRLPLVLNFFATEDRIHALQKKELRAIVDAVLFEPGRYLSPGMIGALDEKMIYIF